MKQVAANVSQVIEDLREECSKYGQVMKVVVPRPPIPQQAHALFNQQNYGKVTVLNFTNTPACIQFPEPFSQAKQPQDDQRLTGNQRRSVAVQSMHKKFSSSGCLLE